MKKAEAEKKMLEHIKEKGLKSWTKMNGEGRTYNRWYYCFFLKNGEQRFWTNPSDEFKKELGVD